MSENDAWQGNYVANFLATFEDKWNISNDGTGRSFFHYNIFNIWAYGEIFTKCCHQILPANGCLSVEKKTLKWKNHHEFSYFGGQKQEWACFNENIWVDTTLEHRFEESRGFPQMFWEQNKSWDLVHFFCQAELRMETFLCGNFQGQALQIQQKCVWNQCFLYPTKRGIDSKLSQFSAIVVFSKSKSMIFDVFFRFFVFFFGLVKSLVKSCLRIQKISFFCWMIFQPFY